MNGWVSAEIVKQHAHQGIEPRRFHYRDAKGLEVDLALDTPAAISLLEMKSGATMNEAF